MTGAARARAPRRLIVSGQGQSVGSEPAVTVRDMVLDHDDQLDDLQAWRDELRGAWKFVKIALGASIVSAIASVVSIAVLVSQIASQAGQ